MRLPQSCSQSLSFHVASITVLIALVAMLPISAQAMTPQLQCSPTGMRFGEVAIGQSESQLIALTNTGTTSVTISAMSSNASEFSPSGLSLPFNLAAGQTVAVNVVFAPTAIGLVDGEVSFTSNASNPHVTLGVVGTGVAREILTAAPSSLAFGQLAVGSNATLSVTVSNATASNVTLTALQTVGSNFSVQGPAFPLVLTPKQSIALSVTFAPQAAGVTSGSVFILGPRLNIPLTGTGTATGQLNSTPTSLSFGNVNVGSTTTQGVTLSAVGGSVTISSATSSNSQFALSGASLPLTIGAGQSMSLNVAFSPTQSGQASGTLTFASNASNSQTVDSLTGTGVATQYSVNLSWSPSTSSVVGYNVYRGTSVGSYSKINSTLDASTTYSDNTVVSGATYYYAATSVNSSGQESGYSTPIQVQVP